MKVCLMSETVAGHSVCIGQATDQAVVSTNMHKPGFVMMQIIILTNFFTRNRPVIQDESSDEEFSVPQGNRGNKRVKVEPETPKSKIGAVEKQTARTDFVADSDDNDSDIVDEFDKIDARMRSRRKQSSTRGEGQKSGQGQRSTSLSPRRVSPSVSPRASPARLSVKGHSRSSAGKEASESVKIEVEDILPSNDLEPSRSKGRSNKGHTVEDTCDEPAVGGSRKRAAAKTEVGSDDFSMAAIPVEVILFPVLYFVCIEVQHLCQNFQSCWDSHHFLGIINLYFWELICLA